MIRGFAARLAWREGRAAYRRLSVFVSSIALGVGSLVAIHSFRADVQRSLGDQARALLGADVRVSSNRAFPEAFDAVLDSMAAQERDVARTTTLASMVLDTRSQGVRLFQIQGVDAGYPYYGEVTSTPTGAWTVIHDGPSAVADPAVFIQLDAAVGDTLLIGEVRFVLRGEVIGLPTELGFQSAIGPRLYISRAQLPATGLLTFGSIARYHANFRMPERQDRDEFWDRNHELLEANQLRFTTAGVRAQEMSAAVEDVSRYLGLMGLAALFLGGIGVASAIHVYIREKVITVAVLRCLGALQRTLFTAYLLQAAGLALIGSVLGVGLGMLVQRGLPFVLSGLLPAGVTTQVSWVALGAGILLGVWVAVMFALGPLLEVRGVSPLIALRHDFEPPKRIDALRIGAFILLALTLVGLTVLEAPSATQGIGFAIVLAGVALSLWATARLLILATKRFFPHRMSYPVRQGVSNLFRPRNQTVSVTLALGFGAFVIGTVGLVEASLTQAFTLEAGAGRWNLLLFDVQPDQRATVEDFVGSRASGPLAVTPLVPSRLSAINGTPVETLLELPQGERPSSWAMRREYRHTYRAEISGSEVMVAGVWWDGSTGEGSDEGFGDPVAGVARISMETDLAESLRVGLGDHVTWDFAGVPVESRITSLRTVDWARFETNFYVIFEPGTLEEAPQTAVILARVEGERERAELQRDLVVRFANVSVLDLSLLQQTIDEILQRANQGIRFLGVFSTVAGVLVLIGALSTSRYQRMRESALLKTLGARRRVVLEILTVEYALLGSLATAAGLVLAIFAGWMMTSMVFEVPFRLDLARLGTVWLWVTAVTVVVGLIGSWGVISRPPLAVLRDVGG
ncbi:MAG: FtsX-like permease family protein [Gemmatimonadetes bacterium]|nr:FtsX-like permease family protein [Gemmatimonadota bacterium]